MAASTLRKQIFGVTGSRARGPRAPGAAGLVPFEAATRARVHFAEETGQSQPPAPEQQQQQQQQVTFIEGSDERAQQHVQEQPQLPVPLVEGSNEREQQHG
eukprot:scaffold58741_cov10-Tisochrysis_lutea.AAC.1